MIILDGIVTIVAIVFIVTIVAIVFIVTIVAIVIIVDEPWMKHYLRGEMVKVKVLSA